MAHSREPGPLPLIPGLTDVIGRPASHDGILFVPILGEFQYVQPRLYLNKHDDLAFLVKLMDCGMRGNDALWVRARLIPIFGINHPTGHGMSTLLNFQSLAIEWNDSTRVPRCVQPFLVADTWEAPHAAISFQAGVAEDTRMRIAAAFWSLLLSDRANLGVFCDYWYYDYDDWLTSISCDGGHIYEEPLGRPSSDPHDPDAWWPFELPRKKRCRKISGT